MDSLKVMILGASRYEFEDDKSKRTVKGTTVHYVQMVPANEEDKVGLFPTKATLPYEYYEAVKGKTFPLYADASISFDLANKRNPIKVTGFHVTDEAVVM